MTDNSESNNRLLNDIRVYWNEHIHDLAVAVHAPGTPEFFEELTAYRFDKLHYLPRIVDFSGYPGKQLLEVGCGVGPDLARFAQGGTLVTGIDLSETAIELARQNIAQQGLTADLQVMNGETMAFADSSFDVVYAHGVLQYTAEPARMLQEIYRVLRPSGQAILMVYNRYSWLNGLSKLMKVGLEHEDAPVLRKMAMSEIRTQLGSFRNVRIVPERFPVPTQLHSGLKAQLYNSLFVRAFNMLPKAMVRPFGWHLMVFAVK